MKHSQNTYSKLILKNEGNGIKMLKKLFKEEKGFTMIELIIVIAIIGIIGAIVAPNFAKATVKSKIRADIASLREVNRQIALYMAEQGKYPEGNGYTQLGDINSDTLTTAGGLKKLVDDEYLDVLPTPQTEKVRFSYDESEGIVKLFNNSAADDVVNAVNALPASDWEFIDGDKSTGWSLTTP